MSSCGWMVASPPRWHGPQVRAPWHHGGHGAVDIVGPMAPPGRASGRGYAGVYADRRKRPLGAATARMQNAPFGHVAVASLVQNAPFREAAVADCGFP